MTVDVVPVLPDPGTDAGPGGDVSVCRLRRQDVLGADAWPGFTPEAGRRP